MPWIPLARTPTPINELPAPPGFDGRLFVKRDDLTSTLYGGNKVRKFEFVLADAERRGAQSLVTIGGIGSNQALAAALHGRARGLAVDVSLVRQPITDAVRRTLRGISASGARIHYAASIPGGLVNAWRALRERRRVGERPYYVPFGATTPLGSLGYVAAGLELAAQVRAGACPPPDRLFVAAGTGGTAAGLLVGCRLGGLETRIAAVRVAHPSISTRAMIAWHADRAAALLWHVAPSVPRTRFRWRDADVFGSHAGAGYGHVTAAACHAIEWAGDHLVLDTTYTGKALAACLAHCRSGTHERTILFWNTHNSQDFAVAPDFAGLPVPLRRLLAES